MKVAYESPEARACVSAQMKARYEDPEARAHQSEISRRPENLAHLRAMNRSPEARARVSAQMKAAYQDPEARARQSARMKAYYARRRAERAAAKAVTSLFD
jgi:hypothetical protein